jgi:membrane-bound lytic murein transglycosylase B
MKARGIRLRTVFLILTITITMSSFSVAQGNVPEEISACYHPLIGGLIERLSQDGFDLEFLSKLFLDPRAELMLELMTISLVSRETTDVYAPFLTPESILLAKRFLQKNITFLGETEKRFQVDKEIMVAILLVESRFGENIGKRRVIPTLASIALIDVPENLQYTYQILLGVDSELAYEVVEGLAKRRAQWAYQELRHFLQIIRNEGMDPLEVRGSYAGALGMPQFLPSSYKTYSLNSKSFEEWLYSKEGAIISIANYLKSNGWKNNLSAQRKRQVIWSYNHSEPYVETILQIAERIKPAVSHAPRSKGGKSAQK